jgi:hypothetical protein
MVPPTPRWHEHGPAKAVLVPIAVIKLKAATSFMALLSMMFSFRGCFPVQPRGKNRSSL